MIYDMCKFVIEKRAFVRAEMLEKLDVFYLRDRLTKEQYEELSGLLSD